MAGAAPALDIGRLIVSEAAYYRGWPCVRGKAYPVALIAIAHNEGASVSEILAEQPHLTAAEVHAALAHYYLNKVSIDRQIDEDTRDFEAERLAQHS